jgi:thiosulfate dehydrogenase
VYVALISAAAIACSARSDGGAETVRGTAEDRGRALFADPRASPSASNPFACATCHPGEARSDRIFPGADLAGVTARASLWGGQRLDLLEAINDCRLSFMDAPAPWTKEDEDARAMYAYLASRGGSSAPAPFDVVLRAPDLPRGDATRGKTAYRLACEVCHGAAHGGDGRIASFVPRLPEDVDAQHASLSRADRRLAYVRKIREGAFRDAAGSMPPFSREALSDDDVAGLLAFLGQD